MARARAQQDTSMIDNIALFIGHSLLALAMWRLVLRDGLDVDPLLDRYRQAASKRARARSNAARRPGPHRAAPRSEDRLR